MSDGTYNRPLRMFEPRAQDQRGPDFRGQESRTPDEADRRGAGSDPLLELARLIGQSDPFAPVHGRASDGRAADAPRGPDSQDRPSQDRPSQDRAPFIRPPARDYAPSQDWAAQDRSTQDRDDPHPAPPRFPIQPADPDPAQSGGHYAPDNAVFARLSGHEEYPGAHQPASAVGYAEGEHYADPQAAPQDHAYGQQGEYAGEYAEGAYEQDSEYEYEAEPDEEHQVDIGAGLRRRNTAKLVIAVLGLAVFGTAAAFGYRAIFKPGPIGPTPVIRADNSPTKVMPVGGDASQKPINERLGDGAGERMVRREEDPADLRSRANGSGVIGAGGPFQGPASAPPATVPASSGPVTLSEPKRVHTVTIRADQGAPPPDRAAPPPSRAAAQRQAAAAPAPNVGGAPMAISPDVPPARVPAAPRTSEGGGFVVQLSAQKSEAEAQATFRSMQTKYAALNGRQPLIRRKDTDHGVFYAAQVGPFGSKGDADQLCESLKSVGGTCFVQRN